MVSDSENSMTHVRKQSSKPPDTEGPSRRGRAAAVGMDAAMLGRAAFERAGFDDATLVLRWREIVGREVARVAQPLRLSLSPSGTVLTLIADPAAAVFLQHETRALCARINAYLGRAAVHRLRFVPGEVVAAPERRRPKNSQDFANGDPAGKITAPDVLRTALLALARARRTT
jgi:hypothetical protein